MNTKQDPRELVLGLLNRSHCAVQVACVVQDHFGVFAWGWNSSGPDGFGLCAERHAISRGNRERLKNATFYVAARRKRNNKIVTALPCLACRRAINNHGWQTVIYRDGNGHWQES